uniref:Protein EFR3-like protein n=1 Tax=Aegilops tauschii TaxID=37682 RepID=M8CM90_AEGTA
MGFMGAKLFPSCESMCVCCPALRPSSRRPVKRYKKLLAEIFPKTPIAKFLEQRSRKELRAAHLNYVKIITEAYSKLLFICKEQMAYFAISLVNVLTDLLESKQENIHILGCQTLARFIYSQVDNTYARNIESLVHKVCTLSRQQGVEHSLLRAASLQCLSAMIWFMKEHSYIFADFDEMVQSVLENYRMDGTAGGDDDRHASQHNWVDEIVRREGRAGLGGGNDVNFCGATTTRLRSARDSSALTREERESPEVWSHICVQKLVELAKESTTMRRILDPMFSYFDMKKQWAPRHGLALLVLSDMSYPEKSSGNEQLILTTVIRHLDHKNILHCPQTKSDIIQTATSLARQLRSRGVSPELAVAGDLCRHLRKTLEAMESASVAELSLNESLQNFLEGCLVEVVKDVRPLYDMMAITLENLPSIPAVARATIGSSLILCHIISLTSVSSDAPMANQTDNTPFNYEAIGHSYSLTVLSSRLKNSSNSNNIQFFQLPLSLRSIALTPSGGLPPSCQRSIFSLATSMLAFAGKVCHIVELAELLRCFTSSNVEDPTEVYHDKTYQSRRWHFPSYTFTLSLVWAPFLVKADVFEDENGFSSAEPRLTFDVLDANWISQWTTFIDSYLRIGEDLQLYVRLQSDLGSYGSESDQDVARSVLSDCRKKVGINDQQVLDVIACALSNLTEMDKDAVAKELTEMFTPEEVPLFGSNSALDWANFHAQAFSDESLSFDEECSRTSSVDGGLHDSPITNTASSTSKITLPHSAPRVLGVGQLLESALHVAGQVAGSSVSTSPLPYGTMTSQCEALGSGTRKKLSSWLVNGHNSTPDNPVPSLPAADHFILPKVNLCGFEINRTSSEPCSMVKLPPASPFDNFLKAAYRTPQEM